MSQRLLTARTDLGTERTAKAFRHPRDMRRYWILFGVSLFLGLGLGLVLILYQNPVPVTSPSFRPVLERRLVALTAMGIAAICQSLATISFQTVTQNRLITPSLLGFEALYATIQTATMFFFGTAALLAFTGPQAFLLQVALMVGMCLLLYGWLLTGHRGNLQLMLLIGIVLGMGLRSLSSFMRRLLAPSEFDILQARLFGSVNHADPSYFPIAIPLVLLAAGFLLAASNRLNILALGADTSISLGLSHQKGVRWILVLVAVLMAVSTALIGPMTFFGFLVATLTYQLAPTYDHKYLFPLGASLGFVVLALAYVIVNHIFHAQGVVTVVIELFGGLAFLILLLKKGAL